MSHESKLQALHKRYELEEQRAVEEFNRILAIVEERKRAIEVLLKDRGELLSRIQSWRRKGRIRALQSSDAGILASGSVYEHRLQAEMKSLEKSIAEKHQELKKALERAKLANEDLLGARVEKKRVEKIMDNRQQSERIADVAREEDLTDELNTFRRDRKT